MKSVYLAREEKKKKMLFAVQIGCYFGELKTGQGGRTVQAQEGAGTAVT